MVTPNSTNSETRSGCVAAYASASVLPHDPPSTSHRSTPRCCRNSSMSATKWGVVLASIEVAGSLACGRLRPAPR